MVERWPEGVSSRQRVRAAAALRLRALAAQPVCQAAIREAGRIAGRHAGLHRPTAVGQMEAGREMRPQVMASVQPAPLQVASMEEPQEPAHQSAGESWTQEVAQQPAATRGESTALSRGWSVVPGVHFHAVPAADLPVKEQAKWWLLATVRSATWSLEAVKFAGALAVQEQALVQPSAVEAAEQLSEVRVVAAQPPAVEVPEQLSVVRVVAAQPSAVAAEQLSEPRVVAAQPSAVAEEEQPSEARVVVAEQP